MQFCKTFSRNWRILQVNTKYKQKAKKPKLFVSVKRYQSFIVKFKLTIRFIVEKIFAWTSVFGCYLGFCSRVYLHSNKLTPIIYFFTQAFVSTPSALTQPAQLIRLLEIDPDLRSCRLDHQNSSN